MTTYARVVCHINLNDYISCVHTVLTLAAVYELVSPGIRVEINEIMSREVLESFTTGYRFKCLAKSCTKFHHRPYYWILQL